MVQAFSNNSNSSDIANTFNFTTPDDRSEILAWLSPLEPRMRHRDIGAQRVDSIGAWVLETEEFRHWHNGNREDGSYHPTLFCEGNPGVGKSYMISLVIDKLCDEAGEGDSTVACFYFDFAARNEQSPVNMLGSLLRQIVSRERKIPEAISGEFRKEQRAVGGRGLQVSGILKMFQTILAKRRTLICIDALDECMPEYRTVVLESLSQILEGSPNTSLLMTGRPHVRGEVEKELGGAATFLFIRATEDGILRFLREKLRKDTTPNIMSSTLEEDIMKSILEISSETFLLASLHIEAILRGTTVARRRKTLKSIKDGVGLGDAYSATLERIKAQDEEKANLAIATLTWICHSEQPLNVEELCHALAVEIGETDFDQENVPSIATFLDCCQGLITVDAEASTVRLVHHTVQEYLCNYPGLFNKPHSVLAETCSAYLNSQQFKNLTSHSLTDRGRMPFFNYAARYWETHRKKDLALGLSKKYEDHISAVSLQEHIPHPGHIGGTTTSLLFSPLRCASLSRIVEPGTELISAEGCKVDQQDCRGTMSLIWAARSGHEEVVKILLERKNIDPNRPDKDGEGPLGWAAIKGHEGVVKLLLEQENVDPNRSDKNGRTPLGCAALEGHEGVVKLLLEREGVDPNRPDMDDRTPLWWAAIKGHERVVKLFLERDNIDPNRPDKDGEGPLGWAAIKGHEGVVKLLLEQENVDPNHSDKNDRTPLGWAAMRGHERVVRLLLERENIDPNRPNKAGYGPLWCAAFKGHEGVVKLLLEREDVDPNPPDKNGRTLLGYAACKGHGGVVKILLEQQGADLNLPDSSGLTPLGYAALEGHEHVVKILLEQKNVDPNLPDTNHRTPLGWAAFGGHAHVVKTLLEQKSVDPNLPDTNHVTPLGWAAIKGHEMVVKLLVEREDVDPNHLDKYDKTPLIHALINGHNGVVRLLLEQGNADPNYPDTQSGIPPC